MLGAIAGDIIGSVYEVAPIKTTDFPLFDRRSTFTDDTVLTVATAEALLAGEDYAAAYRRLARAHPQRGYGGSFQRWFRQENAPPYGSWGNGAAMRVSPVGWAFNSETAVLAEAAKSAAATHNHPEGIKGAQATALAVYLARSGASREDIRQAVAARFGYGLDRRVAAVRPGYSFRISCQETVPEALICFLDAHDFPSTVRNAVSLGGDSDTLACIAGAVAEAFYGPPPEHIGREVAQRLPESFKRVMHAFSAAFMPWSYPDPAHRPSDLDRRR
jgi:ADP-ribosylglycohydrolase